jgi:hypothetical protein
MVSKNLTEDGQRKKWYAARKETLEYKSFELVDLCQAEVALFIRPYGEDNMFVFKSRPDFPEADSVRAFPGYYILLKMIGVRYRVQNTRRLCSEVKTPKSREKNARLD